MSKIIERTPSVLVCLQECERMNHLLAEIRRSLSELELGLKVQFAVKYIHTFLKEFSFIMISLLTGRADYLFEYGNSAVCTVQ